MPTSSVEIALFPCLEDNYGLLLRDVASGRVAAIDTPDADAIAAELDRRGWTLDLILNTHWHGDHVGGNLALRARYGASVTAPAAEQEKIGHVDRAVDEGDVVELGETRIDVWATPGHTLGHIAYHLPEAGVLFVGDTLFGMGCGRLFEGTPAQMWGNMQRFAALPPETIVYCAHEYTASNGRFAITAEPGNPAIEARIADVAERRGRGEPTVPFTIATEAATNPFLRADTAEQLGALRRAKDDFR